MPESELRILETRLASAVEFGHWKRDIDQADTLLALQDIRFSICETENISLSREQIRKLHEMISQKEETLSGQKKQPCHLKVKATQPAVSEMEDKDAIRQTEENKARRKGR